MSARLREFITFKRLCSIVALLGGFENPIAFISALLRFIGNAYLLIKSLINKIGGKSMETFETKGNTSLIAGVMSSLLVVGNLGA